MPFNGLEARPMHIMPSAPNAIPVATVRKIATNISELYMAPSNQHFLIPDRDGKKNGAWRDHPTYCASPGFTPVGVWRGHQTPNL